MTTTPSSAAKTTYKEMTTHIRHRIKVAGIAARVRMFEACQVQYIQVFSTDYAVKFTDDQQRVIRDIAKVNGLTWVRGLEIKIEQMTNPDLFEFVYLAGNRHF